MSDDGKLTKTAEIARLLANDYLKGGGLEQWKHTVLNMVIEAAAFGRFEVLVPEFPGADAKTWLDSEGLKVVGGETTSAPYECKVLLSWATTKP